MKEVLDSILSRTNGEAAVQVLVAGHLLAGGLRRSDSGEGYYEVLTAGQDRNSRPVMIRVTFEASSCQAVFEPLEESPISKPGNGIVIPGVQG